MTSMTIHGVGRRRMGYIAACLFALAAACSSANDGSVSRTIGPNGAVLVGKGGAALAVPAGALGSDVTVTLAVVGRPVLPAGTAAVSEVLRLTPKTQTFNSAVDVTVPISSLPPGRAISEVFVIRGDATTGVMVPIPSAPSGAAALVAQTDTLGDFVAVIGTTVGVNPFAPCGDTTCDAAGSETCSSCPVDCGLCFTAPPGDGGMPLCEVGFVALPGTYPRTLTLAGSLLLGASNLTTTDAFQVFDVSTPTAPSLVGKVNLLVAGSRQIAVRGNHAFVTDGTRIAVIDISVPSTPVEVGAYDLNADTVLAAALGNPVNGVKVWGVAVSGNYAYVPTSDRGFVVLDVSAAPTITRLAHVVDGSLGAWAMAVSGTRAYFTSYESQLCIPGPCTSPDVRGIFVYDVTTPSAPTKLGVFSLAVMSPSDLEVSGNLVYVASQNSQLFTLDVTNPAAITSLTPIDTNGAAYGVTSGGGNLYVSSNSSQQHLQIYSLATPDAPVRLVDQIVQPTGGTWDVATDGTYAFVAGTNRLTVIHSSCR